MKRGLRYLAPNVITATGIAFGMLSLQACFERRFADAAWLIIYAVLTDRLDGFVARAVRGTSELGVQLDSLADFLNFGLAPATLVFASLGYRAELPFADGAGRLMLMAACMAWVFAACFRLARYNITTDDIQAPRIFFGVPTTLAAGTLVVWYLVFLKYAPADGPLVAPAVDEIRLLGDWTTPVAVWRYFPVAMFAGAYLMASSLRMPKLGLARSKLASAFVLINVALGYACGFLRMYPDYILWPPSLWLLVFLAWGQLSPTARQMMPPPIFPPVDPPPGREPLRPEDDLLLDEQIPDDNFQI
jgi:CDP-diacylglycerol--serine O-phosphatidyltransferase